MPCNPLTLASRELSVLLGVGPVARYYGDTSDFLCLCRVPQMFSIPVHSRGLDPLGARTSRGGRLEGALHLWDVGCQCSRRGWSVCDLCRSTRRRTRQGPMATSAPITTPAMSPAGDLAFFQPVPSVSPTPLEMEDVDDGLSPDVAELETRLANELDLPDLHVKWPLMISAEAAFWKSSHTVLLVSVVSTLAPPRTSASEVKPTFEILPEKSMLPTMVCNLGNPEIIWRGVLFRSAKSPPTVFNTGKSISESLVDPRRLSVYIDSKRRRRQNFRAGHICCRQVSLN